MNTLKAHWKAIAFLGVVLGSIFLFVPIGGFLAMFGIAGATVTLLVRLFTKKSKRGPAIMLGSCLALFILALLMPEEAKPPRATDSSSETVKTPPPSAVAKHPEARAEQEAVEIPEPQPVEAVEPATEPDPEMVARNA